MRIGIRVKRTAFFPAGLLLAALLCFAVRPVRADETPAQQDGAFRPGCREAVVRTVRYVPVPAEELRGNIVYEGSFTVRYLKEPDWERAGYQAAALLLENEAGQQYVQPLAFEILPDLEPPVLFGVQRLYGYTDEEVAYLAGVWATDNVDSAPALSVDTSLVKPDTAGVYKITYTASDRSGNTVTQTADIMILASRYTEEYVHELADEVLAEITVPGMTKTEKLRAVFDWCRTGIRYGYGAGTQDRRKAAVQGFTKHAADCFGYYACSRALLDELGVEYIGLHRLGGTTLHYWLLVNVGTGWYHFDPVPARHTYACFMWTDEQCLVKPRFWKYDHTLFPDSATEPFDYEAEVARERAGAGPGGN